MAHKPPVGYENLEPRLTEFKNELKIANATSHQGKRKNESLWQIHKINFSRTRFIFDLLQNGLISKDLLKYLIKTSQCDNQLLSKWKQSGYSNLCCLMCIQRTDFETVCICRVPKGQLDKPLKCVHCGCQGCA
eukprot:NODE_129_length_18551_cov_0.317039.p12 type:complete len:133 gc:universal NODE_129_length_18551_cov_0.317039:12685-12287(-)